MVFLGVMVLAAQAQSFNLLHEFASGAGDGSYPLSSLTSSGSTLYGATSGGGQYSSGVIFKMNTDGSGYTDLRQFNSFAGDGAYQPPYGALTLSGSTIYGLTDAGGASNKGVIFSMGTDGSSYTTLHQFAGGVSDGDMPLYMPTVSGSTLYGMAENGGGSNQGVLFKINSSGTGYSHLHEFAGGPSDGSMPDGGLILSGTTLYGMTTRGGSGGAEGGAGTVFKINTDGTGYSIIHNFAGGAGDGQMPEGSLTLDGTTLYGMTRAGGTAGLGVIFKINADGTGYSDLHEFAGGAGDGASPYGTLTLASGKLYGMASYGGASDKGVLFQINTDGTGYSDLHEFAGGVSDGERPYGDVTLVGGTLYGMTYNGGDNNRGVVFSYSLPVPEPSTYTLLGVGLVAMHAMRRKARSRR